MMKGRTFAIVKKGENKRKIIPGWERRYGCDKIKKPGVNLEAETVARIYQCCRGNMFASQNMLQYYKTWLQIVISKNILQVIKCFILLANKKTNVFQVTFTILKITHQGASLLSWTMTQGDPTKITSVVFSDWTYRS